MSDLFCPASVIVARHAEAQYGSDLTEDAGGSLTLTGRAQSRRMGESLLPRRIAAVWCSDMARAVQTAEIAAAVLDVPVRVRTSLREFAVGDFAGRRYTDNLFDDIFATWMAGDLSGGPGGETGSDVVRRIRAELESIADLNRGETVLVVSHAGAMKLTLPRLATNVADNFGVGKSLDDCATCELAADADGWVLRTWAGVPLSER